MKTIANNLSKTLLIALFGMFLYSSFLMGIEYVPGTGNGVNGGFSNDRDRDFSYHNGRDDQHWFGANKWAVRFDFANVYPTYAAARFIINQAQIYFPTVQTAAPYDSVSIELWTDTNSVPLSRVYLSGKTAVNSHWMNLSIPASQVDTFSVAWLIVNYNTSVTGPFISASTGDGAHSYYWNTNVPATPYFQNMANSGYNCELLFGVRGRFEMTGTDLELFSADLSPQPAISARVTPEFTILNNSSQTINQAYLNVTVLSPDSLYNIVDIIPISSPILPYSELIITAHDPLVTGHTYTLPDSPTQIKFYAVLHSEFDISDTLDTNNSINHYYNCFIRSMPFGMVENFIQTNQSANLLTTQDNLVTQNTKVLNYFPLTNDFYYSLGAYQRFNWYSFNGLPGTVVNGNTSISGFLEPDYTDALTAALDAAETQNTFLELTDTALSLTNPTNLQVSVSLRNSSTQMFDSSFDVSTVKQSRFYGALFQKEELFGDRLIFRRWGAYADTMNSAIGLNATYQKDFNISLQDLDLDSLTTDFVVIYWMQHTQTKQIFYANMAELHNVVVEVEDNNLPGLQDKLKLSPNPSRLGSSVIVTIPEKFKASKAKYTIYNLKGQVVSKQSAAIEAGNIIHLNTTSIPSVGMYILKVSLPGATQNTQLIKRLIVY